MKEKGFKNFMKKNGFYVALFSAVFLVVAIAVVVSLNNIKLMSEADPDDVITDSVVGKSDSDIKNAAGTTNGSDNYVATTPVPTTTADTKQTNKSNQSASSEAYSNPYQAPYTPSSSSTGVAGISTDKSNNDAYSYSSENKTASSDTNTNNDTAKNESAAESKDDTATVEVAKAEVSDTEAKAEIKDVESGAVADQSNASEEAENTEAVAQAEAIDDDLMPTFSSFTENNEMIWPVEGAIAMDYSSETCIYDKTLEQYRTNYSISILAAAGTEVKAAASGEVTAVTWNKQNGYTVIVDNGNGWTTTYSQLQKEIAVSEGQVVMAGDVIGKVNTPTNYGIALGEHLEFAVTKDSVPHDPKMVLAQR